MNWQAAPVIGCRTEYDTLDRVIVCPPTFMAIDEVINDVQKVYAAENINKRRAMKQHRHFVETLQKEGVTVIELPARAEFPEQVFTRDIGFTIGPKLFVSNMANPIRQGEELILKMWASSNGLKLVENEGHSIEGGDVIVDGRYVYVGVSDRTCEDAISELADLLSEFEVVPVKFDAKYLHLDCVFNVLSPAEALVFSEAIEEEALEILRGRYELIEVSDDEQFSMGTNVLSIGRKRVISLPQNKLVNAAMREHGYRVIEVDLSEIIKSGGSFRCCTLPVKRK